MLVVVKLHLQCITEPRGQEVGQVLQVFQIPLVFLKIDSRLEVLIDLGLPDGLQVLQGWLAPASLVQQQA